MLAVLLASVAAGPISFRNADYIYINKIVVINN